MATQLRLIVDNDEATVAAGRQRAAEAIVGKASGAQGTRPSGVASAAGGTAASTSAAGPVETFSNADLALLAAALTLVDPVAAAHAEETSAVALAEAGELPPAEPAATTRPTQATGPALPPIVASAEELAAASGAEAAASHPATSEGAAGGAAPASSGAPEALPGQQNPAGATANAPHRAGSSTAINLILPEKDDGTAQPNGTAPSASTEPATPLGTGLLTSLGTGSNATTFVISVPSAGASPANIIGQGADDAVDLSGITLLAPAAPIPIVRTSGADGGGESASDGTIRQISAGNGVVVDLADLEVEADGSPSINAWLRDAGGQAATPLAHIENVDIVIGTIGNDIVLGDEDANTFVYTARGDAVIDADGRMSVGPGASYGFDIYAGGPANSADDSADAVDFSRLGADGDGGAPLPFAASGITVDLEQAVTVVIADPYTGADWEVTGSLVSTIGGSERVDLALLTFSNADPEAEGGASSIETIVGSGGADTISGDADDNTYVLVGDGSAGASTFDGRDGEDTIDFSRLTGEAGVNVDLGATDGEGRALATSLAGDETPLVALSNVENVIGSSHDDHIEGDEDDNFLFGGEGSDTFVFADWVLEGGVMRLDIGHDTIADFQAGLSGDGDKLVLSNVMFDFDGDISDFKKILKVLEHAHEDEGGLVIDIDENNSIRLENVHFDDIRVVEDGTISLTLQFHDAFLFI